ncbi:VWA domain-containing protein [Pseudomonas tructae]|uniref:VWA domain-containing protein n=1 Tax=Pseudomonas tructae TaxID=2518644 RepID=A0A411MIY4_9PSED|nr:VWA domain-containing protein [Pseudomonas tructae]QBF26719.1 VWA domain-containing protein [Pseudomonas tructae]
MWRFEYPWVFLLLPLAWAVYRWAQPYHEARSALRVPFFSAMSRALGKRPQSSGVLSAGWQLPLNLLVFALLVAACARPVLVEQPITHQQPTRDLMLALDISQSMQARDYTGADGQRSDRLTAVKAVVRDFIARRKDDRIGLILFGTGAYPQAPLTLDHASLLSLLDEAGVGMAGPNTALGDAIGLTIKLLAAAKERDKVLILLTDGNDTGSAITPEHAARLARQQGIVVHTIGIGDPEASGEDKVDLQTLESIARTTGGRFWRADDSNSLQDVYLTLDLITPHAVTTLSHQPRRDLFYWPLGAALLALLGAQALAWLLAQRAVAMEP